jgi:hypothetical protein
LTSKLRILKHIAVDDLTKTFAVIYNSQADIIWPDGTSELEFLKSLWGLGTEEE